MKICWKPELIFPFGLLYLYQPSLLCPYIILGTWIACSGFISSPIWFTFFMFTCTDSVVDATDNQQTSDGSHREVPKAAKEIIVKKLGPTRQCWWATSTCLKQSTPVMIQEPAGAVLKQLYHFLWFAHMSLMLRNFKELKDIVALGDPEALCLQRHCPETRKKSAQGVECSFLQASCQCQHSQGKASLMCPS